MKIRSLFSLPLLALCLGLSACKSTVPVDVLMDGNDVFFVLESPETVSSIRVMPLSPAEGQPKLVWEARHDMTTPLKDRKYPVLEQIRYGQKIEQLPVTLGPLELARDVEYVVAIEIGKVFAQDNFIITKENTVVMPHPAFERQKGRSYEVVADKDGRRGFVLRKR